VAKKSTATNGKHNRSVRKASTRSRGAAESKRPPRKPPKPIIEPTSAKAVKLAINLVEFQKVTLGNALALLSSAQDQSEKLLHAMVLDAGWMPKEGRKMAEEWLKAARRSRDGYRKAMDKSFDLLSAYLQQVQKGQGGK